MKLYALAKFFEVKWGQQNYLPGPQEDDLKERRPADVAERRPPFQEVPFEQAKQEAPKEWSEGVGPAPVGQKQPVRSPYDEIKGPADTSLGVPIAADRAQRWKDNLILVYDRIKEEMVKQPYFKALYSDIGEPQEEKILAKFNHLLNAYVPNIANSNLKDAFLYGVKYVDAFNALRDELPWAIKDREKMHRVDDAIYRMQLRIWDKVKDVLNIHDMKGTPFQLPPDEMAEMLRVIKSVPRGTWKYGPMANPTKPPFHKQRRDNTRKLIKRIMNEPE